MSSRFKFTEEAIASHLAMNFFNRKCLVVVNNCLWTGYECDILAITNSLKVIDIEIKISRADLKADADKDKWYHYWNFKIDGPRTDDYLAKRRKKDWPSRVWKHYYAVPMDIWQPDMAKTINQNSGILLIGDQLKGLKLFRAAKPDRSAQPISHEDAIDIARLASLRMWNAYEKLESFKQLNMQRS